METSSPLAAMHRPAPAFDLYRPNLHVSGSPGKPRNAGLNLGAQFRGKPDYFALKPVHGSSPAGSLAADLCQNFRIGEENSPRFPTPRRSLFTANVMAATSDSRDYITTPPLPATSSPGYEDMMDISPLPRKMPIVTQIEVQSPSPLPISADEEMTEFPIVNSSSFFLEPPKPFAAEKPFLRRPSLTRTKGYSTGTMQSRLHIDSTLQNFRFGGESRATSSSTSSLNLSECFDDSPPQDRRPQTANSPNAHAPGAMRARPQFSSLSSATGMRSGSPAVSHARRPSNPFNRPRRPYRRSLSMFENPAEMVKSKREDSPPCSLAAVMDSEEPHEPVLPHFFPEGQTDSIPRIDRPTLLEVLDGKYGEQFDQKLIIDCRFEYEFQGGHIDGAINYNDKDLLASHLFQAPLQGKTLVIFHCEYSAHRAPMMARHIRAADRTANAEQYPRLTYPEVYILDGGYSGFFAEHPVRCYPQAYVEMDAVEHAYTCEREMGRLRQNRKGLNRAKTFAFGSHEPASDDSPMAQRSTFASPTRLNAKAFAESPSMMIGASPILGERCHAKRLASY